MIAYDEFYRERLVIGRLKRIAPFDRKTHLYKPRMGHLKY